MSRVVKFGCFLLLALAAWAQNPATIRVGVAVMQNISTRPFPSRGPRARLVFYLNGIHGRRGQPRIEAVALEGTGRAAAQAEATAKQCEYVVLTTLVTLQALDPAGKIRVGIDRPQPPGPPYPNSPVYLGVMKFELMRRGETLTESSVRSGQRITADDMIDVLMSQVAERVRKEIVRKP